MQIILSILLNGFAVFIAAYLLSGVHIENFFTAVLAGIILGVLNMFLKPILVILTLPINILTLWIFVFVINAVLVLLASAIIPGFYVDGIVWALLFSLVVSLVNSFFNMLKKGV